MTATRPPTMTEAALQQAVLDLARDLGWLAYHTHDSRRSEPGFPDAILIRRGRLLAVEFKSERGQLTDAQRRWLHAFLEVGLVEPLVIRPATTMDAVAELLR